MNQKTKLPQLPDKAPHFFVRVAFDFLPEISYEDLVQLCHLTEKTGRKDKYKALVDCLIKMQWAKIAGLEAIAIEEGIAKQSDEETIPYDPIGQAQHSKALFDFVSHGKASLDSIAVFLNTYFNLEKKGGQRDLRRYSFQQIVIEADEVIGEAIKSLKVWLDKNRNNSDSIIATRDEWLHRGSPPVQALVPPPDIGYLPIPRDLKGGFPSEDIPLSSEYFWTTKKFIEFHFEKMSSLFNTVVKRCVEIEQTMTSMKIPLESSFPHRMSFFPMRATKDQQMQRMKTRIWNPVFVFNANKILEELPEKLLRFLTKNESGLFAKLMKYRTFRMCDLGNYFVLADNVFLETTIGINMNDLKLLERIGLLYNSQIVLTQGDTLICGYRGLRISWNDDKDRNVSIFSVTRVGSELAKLVKLKCDNDYINNMIGILNSNKINIQLLAISDIQGSTFKYDNLETYNYME